MRSVALAVAGIGLACGVLGRGGDAPSVVLVTVDTLRADQVGAYAGDGTATPHADALAREGTLFERAMAPLPLTRPSHFSMLTGLYPREHGVLNNAMVLPEAARTLPEILREHGYRTAAFTGVSLLGPASGAAQGFETFATSSRSRERSAAAVVSEALGWVASLGPGERFFLWVHLFDPHLPYEPGQRFREHADPELEAAYPSLSWGVLEEIARAHGGDVPGPVLEHARGLYRAEVAGADHWLGELLKGLESQRPPEQLLVVLTADHGECFENGIYFEHADCLYEGAVHVPLIVRQPGRFAAGVRVPHPASVADVLPTVLRAAGIEVPAVSGQMLQEGSEWGERTVLVQHPWYQPRAVVGRRARQSVIRSVAGLPTREIVAAQEWVGIVSGRWKYLRRGDSEELYSLLPRPDESANRVASEPAARDAMRQALDAALAAHPLTRIESAEINPELEETLRALGYLTD